MNIEKLTEIVLIFSMVVMSLSLIACMIRGVLGPKFTDRLLAINVMNVETIMLILLAAAYLKKGYIIDVAIVYSLLGFLSVVVLGEIFLKLYLKKNGLLEEEVLDMKREEAQDGNY